MQIIPKAGDSYEYKRIFTRNDILDFARLTGDDGDHHTNPHKKVIAQGLLVASIVTKLGGDMNYVARTMTMEFIKPVYEGEEILGRMIVTRAIKTAKRVKLTMSCECVNDTGEIVVQGETAGQVWLS